MSDAVRKRTPDAERAHRRRLRRARGQRVLEDVVVDDELFSALLRGRGVSPSIKDKKKHAKEAGAVLDEAGRRWLQVFVTRDE